MPDSADAPGVNPVAGQPALGKVGKYDLLKKIADGGMGSIYLGRNPVDGTVVAIKVMSAIYVSNPVLVKRFEQEFRVASRINHPNLVRALEYGETADSPYLVMEFIDGESLGAKVEREGPMEELAAIKIIAQVAQALHRVHKENLVHRDVKPDNILLEKTGVAKLTDLGLVKEKQSGDMNLTRSGRGLGTPNFMAPEQFRDAKNADPRCDIYSLGATFYTLVTGELPYKCANPLDAWMQKVQNELIAPKDLNPKISHRTDWAIRRAMNGDPAVRPANCREFIEDITGRTTRNTIEMPKPGPVAIDTWYLSYQDKLGSRQVVKGSTKSIRKSFRDGILEEPGKFRASRSNKGPFVELQNFPEFRDLAFQLPKPKPPKTQGEFSGPITDSLDETAPYKPLKKKVPLWIYLAISLIFLFGLILAIAVWLR